MTAANSEEALDLSAEQVETMAAGLYQLAKCDGLDQSGVEMALINEFVADAGYAGLADRLSELSFDPASAFRVLDSSWLRKLFLEAALLVVKADGVISDEERETFEWMSMAFGIAGGLDAIESQIADASL
ncbi:MAG: hypothetical protein ACI9OJ_001437 [Myxococcota bacterium]